MTKTFKRPISFLSAVVMFMVMLLYFPSGTFSNDFGLKASAEEITPTQPSQDGNGVYQIGTKEELYWFANHVNAGNTSANAVLTTNIIVNEGKKEDGWIDWTPIGNKSNKYKGTFDGQSYTISGLYFDDINTNYVGLFGYNSGTIKNVGVIDSYFIGNDYIGGVCGCNSAYTSSKTATIENCYNTGYVTANGTYSSVGGVCGCNGDDSSSGTAIIENCYNTGYVTGKDCVGGVCGYNYTASSSKTSTATIKNCYNIGSVTSNVFFDCIGGVCGWNYDGTITNCYNSTSMGIGMGSGTVEIKSATKFNSGEVAYLLQSGQTADEDGNVPEVWGQDLSKTDSYPVLGGATVYRNEIYAGCIDNKGEPTYSYSNEKADTIYAKHKYDINGFCTFCGGYESTTTNDNGYYEISNVGQLYWFAQQVNNGNNSINAVLTADITVNINLLTSLQFDGTGAVTNGNSFTSWTPIGNNDNPYTGTFDGKEFNVSGLYFNDTNTNYVGLFGCNSGTVKNVGVVDSYFNGDDCVGGVCGYNSGTIIKCYNTGSVSGSCDVGGVCGFNYATSSSGTATATIENCYNTGSVSGSSNVGGVCGKNSAFVSSYEPVTATITNCYNTGSVSNGWIVGGVCGYNYACSDSGTATATATITNCYFNSNVYTGSAVGTNNGTVSDNVLSKTKAQFNSGEVAYLLQGEQTETVWGQTLSGDDKQDYPVLGDAKVYQNETYAGCEGNKGEPTYSYSNTKAENVYAQHDYDDNGICKRCGGYHPAEKNASGVYEISTAAELYWFAQQVNGGNTSINAVLTADITVNRNIFPSWTPIGKSSNRYTGTFDGQNHTISNLYFYDLNADYVGLFGYNKGTIKNVGVNGSYFYGHYYVGGVCGVNNGGTIENSYNTGTVKGSYYVGGVCGYNCAYVSSSKTATATIKSCYNTGIVNGSCDVGGVCGYNEANSDSDSGTTTATIENSYNTGSVTASHDYAYVGGVCGSNKADASSGTATATIKDCHNIGTVSGTNDNYAYVGSMCGFNYATVSSSGTATATIENSYNTGSVTASGKYAYVGGVCGRTNTYVESSATGTATVTIENCYNEGDVSGVKYVGGVCGLKYDKITNCITNCYYLNTTATGGINGEDVTGSAESKTKAQFNSGEVAYLLQSGQTADEDGNVPEVWGQDLSKTDSYPVLGGAKVYKVNKYNSCTESSSEPSIVYSNTNEDIYGEHNYSSGGICKHCGELQNSKDGFKSASLTLTDGVIINYYVILSDDALADTGAYIHFTSAQGLDKKIMLSEGIEDDGKYKFSLELRPDQMAEEITAQVVYSDGSVGNSVDYSVQTYAENVSADEDCKNLVDAMLNFGAFTQLYTNNNTDNLVTQVSDYTTNATISDDYKYKLDSQDLGISVKSASLQIGAYTTIKIKYQLDEGEDIENYTFKCSDTVLEPEKSGDFYYVYLRNISPQNLDEMYKFTVSDGTNTTTLEYSAFSYMKNILDNSSSYEKNLVNLMNAMYDYNQAANTYVGQ